LRYAFARCIDEFGPVPEGSLTDTQVQALEDFLAGEGIDDDLGAEIVARWTLLDDTITDDRPTLPDRGSVDFQGVVLIDDASEVDDPSLDILAKAAVLSTAPIRVVMRLDAGSSLPPSFESLPAGPQILLPALEPAHAQQLAAAVAPVPLPPDAAARWAERGRHVPLGIVEAVALGVGTGAFASENGARPASLSPDTDAGLEASEWIRRRYDLLTDEAKAALRAAAVLGLDVPKALLHELLETLGQGPAAHALEELATSGWIEQRAGSCAFASRTHHEVVLEDVVDDEERRLHESASILIEKRGGKLAAAEAARHAAQAGNHTRSVSSRWRRRKCRASGSTALRSAPRLRRREPTGLRRCPRRPPSFASNRGSRRSAPAASTTERPAVSKPSRFWRRARRGRRWPRFAKAWRRRPPRRRRRGRALRSPMGSAWQSRGNKAKRFSPRWKRLRAHERAANRAVNGLARAFSPASPRAPGTPRPPIFGRR
jgi:hypothetical protein